MVRPLSPNSVEAIRNFFIERDDHLSATVVAVVAYSGLRPGELRGLTWEHVRESVLRIEQAIADDGVEDTKTKNVRTVRLLSPLKSDLLKWQLRTGHRSGPVFRSRSGGHWSDDGWKKWQTKKFKVAAKAIGFEGAVAYDLRHSFASLLIHEGMNVIEVAAQLGHSPAMTLSTYAHLFTEAIEERSAEEAIEAARDLEFTKSSPRAIRDSENHLNSAPELKPTPGFEPGTPSLRVKCSTN